MLRVCRDSSIRRVTERRASWAHREISNLGEMIGVIEDCFGNALYHRSQNQYRTPHNKHLDRWPSLPGGGALSAWYKHKPCQKRAQARADACTIISCGGDLEKVQSDAPQFERTASGSTTRQAAECGPVFSEFQRCFLEAHDAASVLDIAHRPVCALAQSGVFVIEVPDKVCRSAGRSASSATRQPSSSSDSHPGRPVYGVKARHHRAERVHSQRTGTVTSLILPAPRIRLTSIPVESLFTTDATSALSIAYRMPVHTGSEQYTWLMLLELYMLLKLLLHEEHAQTLSKAMVIFIRPGHSKTSGDQGQELHVLCAAKHERNNESQYWTSRSARAGGHGALGW
eukprot:1355433-Rhodomonas_salina.5